MLLLERYCADFFGTLFDTRLCEPSMNFEYSLSKLVIDFPYEAISSASPFVSFALTFFLGFYASGSRAIFISTRLKLPEFSLI